MEDENLEYFDESEEDVVVDFLDKIYETVLWSTDWTVETINASLSRDSFDLDPSFQRRNAWNSVQKSRLIESLIFNLPIPQIVLAESKIKRGSFIVVDGKQRLITIKEFFDNNSNFKLSGLNNKSLNGMDKNKLLETFPEYYNNLLVYTIRSVIIKNWPSENFLYTIFFRLNTGSLQLSPQELRKSLKPGNFLNFIDAFASKSKIVRDLIGKKEPDPRMKDLDLILRFVAFNINFKNYKGNYKEFIDGICDIYNNDWNNKKINLDKILIQMEDTIKISIQIFGKERVFRREGHKRTESRINRALFDVIMYFFSRIDHKLLILNDKEIKNKVTALTKDNNEFISSISLATNGLSETKTRFEIFGNMLNTITGISVEIPKIGNHE
jgi:hypothetical protein